MTHVVCVEAYEGAMEPLAGGGGPRMEARGLGLPWPELARRLGATVTLLDWDAWYAYESTPWSIPEWTRFPLTRAVTQLPLSQPLAPRTDERIRRRSVEVIDPDHGQPLGLHPSPRSHGMLAEGDPLFFLSVVLHESLLRLHREQPIDLVILPMWGGLGYVAQLERATTDAWAATAFGVLVTSDSATRLHANQEGDWTRAAIARRQREELSLALADIALAFGPQGAARAKRGRLHGAPATALAPRDLPGGRDGRGLPSLPPVTAGMPPFVCRAPCDGASGVLALLEAARLMDASPACITFAGPDLVFAPMAPRSFREFWSGRGWVRDLVDAGRWCWKEPFEDRSIARSVDLRVGSFSHLDHIWTQLARGDVVVVSQAVADGLGLDDAMPCELVVEGEPSPESIARSLSRLAASSPAEVDALRRAQYEAVLASRSGRAWQERLDMTTDALDGVIASKPAAPSLAQVLQRQSDPRIALRECRPMHAAREPDGSSVTLTVVVTSYGMGDLARQSVESIWQSSRLPDDLIVIDDGSRDPGTLVALEDIAKQAAERGYALRIIRQGNRGLAGARNAALAAASGTFISFLDGDDLVMPTFYELALALLQREPEIGAVSAWAELFGDGTPDGFWNAPQPELPLLLVENQVIVPAVTRTALLRALGGYDARQVYSYEDWELSVRYLTRGYPIVTIPRYLQRYRVRADSMYHSMNPTQHVLMRERLLASHRPAAESFSTEVALQLEHRHWQHLHTQAARALSLAVAEDTPSSSVGDKTPTPGVGTETPALFTRARQAVARTVKSVRRVREG